MSEQNLTDRLTEIRGRLADRTYSSFLRTCDAIAILDDIITPLAELYDDAMREPQSPAPNEHDYGLSMSGHAITVRDKIKELRKRFAALSALKDKIASRYIAACEEKAKMVEQFTAVTKERDGWKEEAGKYKRDHDEIHKLYSALTDVTAGNYWAWQGDGMDHLESLTCPVVIRPEQLREIIKAANLNSEVPRLEDELRHAREQLAAATKERDELREIVDPMVLRRSGQMRIGDDSIDHDTACRWLNNIAIELAATPATEREPHTLDDCCETVSDAVDAGKLSLHYEMSGGSCRFKIERVPASVDASPAPPSTAAIEEILAEYESSMGRTVMERKARAELAELLRMVR